MSEYLEIEDRIAEAMEWKSEHPNACPITKLAEMFDVPYQRLNHRLHKRNSKSTRMQTNLKLDEVQEEALISYLKRCDKIGVPVRLNQLAISANSILKRSHSDLSTPPPRVSKMWASRWKQRHPEWHIKRTTPLESARAGAHDVEDIQWWFDKYKAICDEHGIQPPDVWNMDETGFRIGIARDQLVLTQDPDKRQFLPAPENRESVTVVEAISASGGAIAPMIIISGKTHQGSWFQHLHDNTLIGVSETGYTNDDLTLEWLKHFQDLSAQSQEGAYRLLLMDGYGSHCTKEFIEFCDKAKIIPFNLPSHTTHIIQPLDVVVFQPYKHYHAEAIDASIRAGVGQYNKLEFLADFERFRARALTTSTIRSAFKKTGLVPFDPNVVLVKARQFVASLGSNERPKTPTPREQSTPKTQRTLRHQLSTIWDDSRLDAGLQTLVAPAFKGAMIQATAGAEAISDLEHSTVAGAASRARSLQKRSTLQKGGVLKASRARQISSENRQSGVEVAKRALERAEKVENKTRTDAILKQITGTAQRPAYKLHRRKVLPLHFAMLDELHREKFDRW